MQDLKGKLTAEQSHVFGGLMKKLLNQIPVKGDETLRSTVNLENLIPRASIESAYSMLDLDGIEQFLGKNPKTGKKLLA
jgi:hypothetical protein